MIYILNAIIFSFCPTFTTDFNNSRQIWNIIHTNISREICVFYGIRKTPTVKYANVFPSSVFNWHFTQLPADILTAIHDADDIHRVFEFIWQIKHKVIINRKKPEPCALPRLCTQYSNSYFVIPPHFSFHIIRRIYPAFSYIRHAFFYLRLKLLFGEGTIRKGRFLWELHFKGDALLQARPTLRIYPPHLTSRLPSGQFLLVVCKRSEFFAKSTN